MTEEQIEQKATKYTDGKFERDTLWWADAYEAYIAGATENTELLSKHILELQKDKGVLTDKVAELEAQIEKMKKYIKACWVEEKINDYSSYITNTSDEFRDLVKELNNEVRNGR